MEPQPHTDESIRFAMEEFLALLDVHDVPSSTGYYRTLPSRTYFAALRNDEPGAWESAIRNISYGLDRFSPGLVVDMGCGHGLQAFVFAAHGRAVLGIDQDEDRVAVANTIVQERGMDHIEFRVGNARTVMSELSAGAVWHHRSLHHIPDRLRFEESALSYFRSVHSALDPGGSLVFMTSNAASRSLLPGVRPGQHRARQIRALLQQAGFVVGDLRYHGFLSAIPARVRPRRTGRVEAVLARTPVIRAMGGSFSVAAYAE